MANCFGNSSRGFKRSARAVKDWVLAKGQNDFGEYELPIARKGKIVAYAIIGREELDDVGRVCWHQCPDFNNMMTNVVSAYKRLGMSGMAKKGQKTGSHKKPLSGEDLIELQRIRRNGTIKPYGCLDDWLKRSVEYVPEAKPFPIPISMTNKA